MITTFTGKYRFLSNFYPSYVPFAGMMYPTLEHAFQAAKTIIVRERITICQAATPGAAKRIGRSVTLRGGWDQMRLGVMLSLLREKFSDKRMQEWLLLTGDQELIEGNIWNDTFWGVCKGQGQNNLGKLLMQVRAEVKAERIKSLPAAQQVA